MTIVVKAFILCGIILMAYNVIQCLSYFTAQKDIITEFEGTQKLYMYSVYAICILFFIIDIAGLFFSGTSVMMGFSTFAFSLMFTILFNWGISVSESVKGKTQAISETLIGIIEAGDANLDGHSILVMDLAMLLYDYLPYDKRKKIKPENLRYAALFLDVGKLGIPAKVLNKPGKLEKDEWEIMKKHPEIGVKVLGQMTSFKQITDWVLYHHERIDGKGYHGLKGDDIPLAARIIAVADTYAAVVMVRSYKPSRSYDDAVATLKLAAGSQLDEEIVNIFCSIPREKVEKATISVIEKMSLFLDDDFREDDRS